MTRELKPLLTAVMPSTACAHGYPSPVSSFGKDTQKQQEFNHSPMKHHN